MNASTAIPVETNSGRSKATMERLFVLTAAVILGATGFAKLLTAFGDTKLLAVVDPILGIQFRHLMLAVSFAELAIACVCVFGRAGRLPTVLVAWLSTSLLVYRLGLWWLHWTKPCGCLGNLTDVLRISPEIADLVIKGTLAYLLVGSYGLIITRKMWLNNKLAR